MIAGRNSTTGGGGKGKIDIKCIPVNNSNPLSLFIMSSPDKSGSNGTEIIPTPEEVLTVVRTRTSAGLDEKARASLETASTTPASPVPSIVSELRRGGTLPSAKPFAVPTRPIENAFTRSSDRLPINDIPAVVKRKVAMQKIRSSRYVRDAVLIALAAAATYGLIRYADACSKPVPPDEVVDESMESH